MRFTSLSVRMIGLFFLLVVLFQNCGQSKTSELGSVESMNLQSSSEDPNGVELESQSIAINSEDNSKVTELPSRLTLYVSPTGDDSKDGLSQGSSIKTLARAQSVVKSKLSLGYKEFLIRISGGTYRAESVVWTVTSKDSTIRLYGEKGKSVYDGGGVTESFFILKSDSGERTNISIENLTIRNYWEAISFKGSRGDLSRGYNSHNQIKNCRFERIGGAFFKKDTSKDAYAVVRLVNSDHNILSGNSFAQIRNLKEPVLLHSFYIAHGSSNNIIERNKFLPQPGDPLRLRDYSNNNIIRFNVFENAGTSAYSEWYCEKAKFTVCTSSEPECPSWENWFQRNTIRGTAVFTIRVQPSWTPKTSACRLKPISERRLRTAENKVIQN